DRMITLDLDHFDEETEVRITEAKSGLVNGDASSIVKIVRGLRDSDVYEFAPTIRGSVMIAKTLKVRSASVNKNDEIFKQTCMDILSSETSRIGTKSNQDKVKEVIGELIDQHC
ncbi:MAG: hypothetical protein KAU60_16505, partial [Desulfobacterales bacterium]|nr:hypothetical protein [Desulfobacterales bacterium]